MSSRPPAFGMQLMHQVGVTTLDQWYSDFVETDWRYVERYYQTDLLPEWTSCVVSGCPLLTPRRSPRCAITKSRCGLRSETT